MKLSIGIVGLPNVGKSTLFKILTKQEVNIANYPFATIDPNVGVVSVPDERLQKLAEISHSKKIIPAVVEFYDIAGLVKGSYKGEGLGNQFLSHIRETQAIVIVLRVFKNPEIIHIEGEPDSLRDLETINTELIFKDLETVSRRLDKAESEARTGKKEALQTKDALQRLKEWLEKGNLPVSSDEIMSLISASVKTTADKRAPARRSLGEGGNGSIVELNLLTAKKQIYLLNGKEFDVSVELRQKIKELDADYIIADLAETEHSHILQNVRMSDLIKKSYEILDLISFFTTGEDETRAWTIKKGTLAPEAAGVIHSDFEKKFIRAEVINWQKLIEAGGPSTVSSGQSNCWNQAKQKGLIRLEGKEYEVQDGDVVVIRHG